MRIEIRFYEELNDFLPAAWRKQDLVREVGRDKTVRQMIEAFGVPTVAVDLILVNGKSAGFSHLLADGDRLSVYPVFESVDISGVSRLPNRPLRVPRFLAADHLEKLTRYLRMLGFDAISRKGAADLLVPAARMENRTILSRYRHLMRAPGITHAYRIRSELPRDQLLEVVIRFDLVPLIRPLSRCHHCNALLEPIITQEMRNRTNYDSAYLNDDAVACRVCRREQRNGLQAERMIARVRHQVLEFESRGDGRG